MEEEGGRVAVVEEDGSREAVDGTAEYDVEGGLAAVVDLALSKDDGTLDDDPPDVSE